MTEGYNCNRGLICTYLNFFLCKYVHPQPLIVQIFPVIDSVVLDERHDILHPRGAALRVAYNEHVARFSDEAAPHLFIRFQGYSRGERDLFSREILTGAQDQGIMRVDTTSTTKAAREDMYLLRDVSVDGFRKLKQVFVAKAGEVVVASYPKSGTTWMQNIVSLIKNNGVDYGEDLDDKWLWIEQFPPAEVEA